MKSVLPINKIIISLFFLALVVVVGNIFWWSNWPELFSGGSELMTLLANLAIGYLVSYVFYLVVVRYKEYRDEKCVISIILPFVEKIIKHSVLINKKIINDESIFLSKDDLKSRLSSIKCNDLIPKSFFSPETTWDFFLIQEKHVCQQQIQRLFLFISRIEPELIQLISDLDDCLYYSHLVYIKNYPEDMRSENLAHISNSLYDHNVIIQKLQGYLNSRETGYRRKAG